MSSECQTTIRSGRNVWLLARTDRDAPTLAEVLQSALAFLEYVIPGAERFEVLQVPDGRDDVATGAIGPARPVIVTAVRGERGGMYPGAELPGELQRRSQDCAGDLQTVRATRPWWVRVGFDWRGSDTDIDWPRLRVNSLGVRSRAEAQDNDWLLVEQRYVGPDMGPDKPWGEAILEGAGTELSRAAVELGEKLASWIEPLLWGAAGLIALGTGFFVAKELSDG